MNRMWYKIMGSKGHKMASTVPGTVCVAILLSISPRFWICWFRNFAEFRQIIPLNYGDQKMLSGFWQQVLGPLFSNFRDLVTWMKYLFLFLIWLKKKKINLHKNVEKIAQNALVYISADFSRCQQLVKPWYNDQNYEINTETILLSNQQTFYEVFQCFHKCLFSGSGSNLRLRIAFSCCVSLVPSIWDKFSVFFFHLQLWHFGRMQVSY